MRINFISGLPRSGTTLLAALLRQNPAFHASIMSPTGRLFTDTLAALSVDNEAECFINNDQRADLLAGVFREFYRRIPADYFFDNNRRWTANAAALRAVFPQSTIVCMVRSPIAIIDSLERQYHANPLCMSKIIGCSPNLTVFSRTDIYMQPDGVFGFAWNGLRDAYCGPNRDMLYLIHYDDFVRMPERAMQDLHAALELPDFDYDFTNIQQVPGVEEFDRRLGTPGLHSLLSAIEYKERESILPPELRARLPQPFWIKKTATKDR